MPLANRTQTIIRHRAEINSLGKFFESIAKGNSASQPRPRGRNATYDTVNPGGGDFPPKFFDKLRPINIGDMDPYQCTPSKGDKITLDIVEDAQSFTRVMLLGQDKTGDVVFVALYCDSPSTQDSLLQDKLGFGCTITIANPFMKIALDGRTMIRVEKDKDMFIHRDKDVKKCRCCGKFGARLRCARCKAAYYCTRKCQNIDWVVLKHKNVCDAFVSNWINNMIPRSGRLIRFDSRGSIFKWPILIVGFVLCCIYFLF